MTVKHEGRVSFGFMLGAFPTYSDESVQYV